MLSQVADGVWVHQSDWCDSNATVVEGDAGVLLVDPGIRESEIESIASDLSARDRAVVAGFATHPHWDHMLWHAGLGTAPRIATALAAKTARQRLSGGFDRKRLGVPDDVSDKLLGALTGLPEGADRVPWAGPDVRIIEHGAHAPGHAALLIEPSGVLVAGDMLSDVFIPMLDLMGAADPITDYLHALELFEGIAGQVNVLVPGHGSVATRDELHARIRQDSAYVLALRDGGRVDDPRIGATAKPGWEFVAEVHERQVARLAQLANEARS